MKRIGLLGTKMTMEREFYRMKLYEAGIEVVIPEKEERDLIQRTINDELVKTIFLPRSKQQFLDVIQRLQFQGAEGVVLGCTEIPLLVKQEDTNLPVFRYDADSFARCCRFRTFCLGLLSRRSGVAPPDELDVGRREDN